MSNEEDKINFKITKIRLPDRLKMIDQEQVKSIESKGEVEHVMDNLMVESRLGDGKREVAPYTKHMNRREDALILRE